MLSCPKPGGKDAAYHKHMSGLCEVGRLGCFVCNEHGRHVTMHHVTGRKNGEKWNLLPLCSLHHTMSNDSAHALGSYRLFDKVRGVDSLAEATRLYDEWLEMRDVTPPVRPERPLS